MQKLSGKFSGANKPFPRVKFVAGDWVADSRKMRLYLRGAPSFWVRFDKREPASREEVRLLCRSEVGLRGGRLTNFFQYFKFSNCGPYLPSLFADGHAL